MERTRNLLYKVGDVVYVTAPDYEGPKDTYQSGIIVITDITDPFKEAKNGCYETKHISGDITWSSVNCDHLDLQCWSKLIGNIKESRVMKVLYGRS